MDSRIKSASDEFILTQKFPSFAGLTRESILSADRPTPNIYVKYSPPFTCTVCPVMKRDAG